MRCCDPYSAGGRNSLAWHHLGHRLGFAPSHGACIEDKVPTMLQTVVSNRTNIHMNPVLVVGIVAWTSCVVLFWTECRFPSNVTAWLTCLWGALFAIGGFQPRKHHARMG